MDVKSAFSNGRLKEEVYMEQPPGFEKGDESKVYRLHKAVYGLKQTPRAWYETLAQFLLNSGIKRGRVNKTLLTIKWKGQILLVQVYVDDIIFGSKSKYLCERFDQLMQFEYKMSMMVEMSFYLGLQVKQLKEGIYTCQTKYALEPADKFGINHSKTIRVPMLANGKINQDLVGKHACITPYRGIIGSPLPHCKPT